MPPTIRMATLADADQVQAIYAPYCETPISFEIEPPNVDEMRRRMEKVIGVYPWLVCADGDAIIAYVYASQHRERYAYRWSVDTTVYVRQGGHRRGVGRALYTSLLAMLPLQGYVNAFAGVTLPNPASVGLHEAMGFRSLGVYAHVGFKHGRWHDVGWFQRLLQPHPDTPGALRPVTDAHDSPEWAAALQRGIELLGTAEKGP